MQNWLAAQGIGEQVQSRDVHHPEPPGGLWTLINGGIAISCLGGMIAIALFAVVEAIPELFGLSGVSR